MDNDHLLLVLVTMDAERRAKREAEAKPSRYKYLLLARRYGVPVGSQAEERAITRRHGKEQRTTALFLLTSFCEKCCVACVICLFPSLASKSWRGVVFQNPL